MPEKNTLHKAGDYILEGPLMAGSSGENFSFQDIVSERVNNVLERERFENKR